MRQIILETVVGKLTLDAVSRAAHAGAVRASALDHKAFDDAVEDQSVIEAFFYKRDKIVHCIRGNCRVQLCFHDIAVFHFNGNDGVLCHK